MLYGYHSIEAREIKKFNNAREFYNHLTLEVYTVVLQFLDI